MRSAAAVESTDGAAKTATLPRLTGDPDLTPLLLLLLLLLLCSGACMCAVVADVLVALGGATSGSVLPSLFSLEAPPGAIGTLLGRCIAIDVDRLPCY